MKKLKLLSIILLAAMCLSMVTIASIGVSAETVSFNIATGKTIVAGNGQDATGVVNGSTAGYFDAGFWTSMEDWNTPDDGLTAFGTEGTCYVEIDLGEECLIDKIKVVNLVDTGRVYKWEAYATTDNTADISTWTLIGEKTNDDVSTAAGTTVEFEEMTARYVRVYGTYHSANVGYHFAEVEVFSDVELT